MYPWIKLPQVDVGGSAFDAGVKGLEQGQKEYDRNTLFDLGQKAMRGDWKGAQNTAFERGNPDAGFKIQGHRQAQADRGRELEKKMAQDAAGIFQNFIDKEADPARRGIMTQKFIETHPEIAPRLQRYGINAQDPSAVSSFFQATARGYQDPQEAEKAQLGLDLTRAQIGHLNRDADTSKVIEVNGRLFRYGPTGQAEDIGGADPSTVGALDLPHRANIEEGLRKEITANNKDYFTIRDATAKLESVANDPSAGSDVALIFSYMKILDPGSVVRETEFATAQNATGVPEQVRNAFNRALSGERLAPEQRTDFLNVAKRLAASQETQYRNSMTKYGEIAKRLGVDVQNVVGTQSDAPEQIKMPDLSTMTTEQLLQLRAQHGGQ